jgi:polyferredoxin
MKEDIEQIKERNKRVEADKSWETSKTRRLIIALMTYIIIVVFLWSIEASNPWFNAIVPTIGFILSTLTLPFFKRFWLKHIYKK